MSRGRHGEFRKQPPDAYAKLPNCDWISVYLSVDMCKRYCLYEAESEEAASEARNGANAKIDKIVRVDALAESELRE